MRSGSSSGVRTPGCLWVSCVDVVARLTVRTDTQGGRRHRVQGHLCAAGGPRRLWRPHACGRPRGARLQRRRPRARLGHRGGHAAAGGPRQVASMHDTCLSCRDVLSGIPLSGISIPDCSAYSGMQHLRFTGRRTILCCVSHQAVVGDERKDAKAGGMHLHLFRRGASDGSQTPFRWTRTNMPDVRHMLQPDDVRACLVLQLMDAGCRMQA